MVTKQKQEATTNGKNIGRERELKVKKRKEFGLHSNNFKLILFKLYVYCTNHYRVVQMLELLGSFYLKLVNSISVVLMCVNLINLFSVVLMCVNLINLFISCLLWKGGKHKKVMKYCDDFLSLF